MNYKKSILSLVTIMALSGTASADSSATYLPLTSDSNDASWTLFGVNGFSNGTPSLRGSSSDGFSADYVSITEVDTQDYDATDGLAIGSNYLMSVQAIDDTGLLELQVAAKIEHPIFEPKEPVRSMYIRVNSGTPNVKIDYKASMEGQRLELIANGSSNSTLYYVIINEDNTYSNAAVAQVSTAASSDDAELSNIVDVLDYNFLDNPVEAQYYDKSQHLDTAVTMVADGNKAETAIFYHYDSVSQQWKIWDKDLTGAASDFTAFKKGDAYWGLIDTNDKSNNLVNDPAEANVTKSGLILGSSGETSASTSADAYLDDTGLDYRLQDGWNMVAIDDVEPHIRHAATGLVATFNTANNNGTITITDSSDLHDITIDINATTTADIASEINLKIEREKLLGNIPSSINIKAFGSGTSDVVIISDAKFKLTDMDDNNNIAGVVTLSGANPYDDSGVDTSTISDLNESSTTTGNTFVTSVYGEYSLMVDLLTNDLANDGNATANVRVAADLDAYAKTVAGGSGSAGGAGTADYYSAKIELGTASKDSYTAVALTDTPDAIPNKTDAKTQIETHDILDGTDGSGKVISVDTNGNGFDDKVIIASTIPFYIKDSTFTRVFTDNNSTNDGVRSFTVSGKSAVSITPLANTAPIETAKLINAKAELDDGNTGVFADVNSSLTGKLIAVSTDLSTFDLKDLEDGSSEFLINETDSSTLAKGAVAGVYSLSDVAKLPVVLNTITFTDFNVSGNDTTDNNITLTINTKDTSYEYNITGSANGVSNESNITDFFDSIVDGFNSLIQEQNGTLHAYAYHTYVDGTAPEVYNIAQVVVKGLDVEFNTTITMDSNGTEFGNPDNTTNYDVNTTSTTSPGAKTLGNSWPTLTGNLQTNAIYTPNYASYGPLYVFNNAGFNVRSILKATTEFSSGSIAWDGIDLTRDENDWLVNNEFNLFSSNVHSGYWVYLETNTAGDSVQISNATFTPTYTYYFDNKDANDEYPTTNIINGGQFTVDIEEFGDGVTNAYVTVEGVEIQLKSDGTSNGYTADITSYTIAGFTEGSATMNFTVRATDGKGEDKKESGILTFDYEKPTISAPTQVTSTTVKFSADSNASDVHTYHVFKEYIPELATSRTAPTAATNRLVNTYVATAGEVTTNLCASLTFGDADNLRIVGVDGEATNDNAGVIGYANVSDAVQLMYIASFNNSHVLTHTGGDTEDKAIYGKRYDETCTARVETLDENNNTGVSLKSLASGVTARLAYEEVPGVNTALSGAWVSTYEIGSSAVIQVQNIEEYAGEPFYVEYGGKMYRSAFPETQAVAMDSALTPIKLDDTTAFALDATTGLRDTSGGTGEELTSVLNNTLQP